MSAGKCPDCYGDGVLLYLHFGISECRTCNGSGLVPDEFLAQREAEYHAWLRKRKWVKA